MRSISRLPRRVGSRSSTCPNMPNGPWPKAHSHCCLPSRKGSRRCTWQCVSAGFQAHVLGYDPHVSAEQMRADGVDKRADLHAMLAECDFVSIHCVLNEITRGLIGERELAHMKPDAILINVSRGAIVDEPALVRALTEGRLGGA